MWISAVKGARRARDAAPPFSPLKDTARGHSVLRPGAAISRGKIEEHTKKIIH